MAIQLRSVFIIVLCFVSGVIIDFGADPFIQLLVIHLLINIILGLSLNLVNGMTGQLSLGHAGFMAVGAYTSAYFSRYFGDFLSISGSFFILHFIGGISAAILGILVGVPSLRLKGDYLAIVTLGFAEVIRIVLLNLEVVGGARGLYGIVGSDSFIESYIYGIVWVLVTFVILWRLRHSILGRQFLSIREDELAAQFLGVHTAKIKIIAFVVSSFFTGIAGSLFAHDAMKYLNPSSFTFQKSIEIVIIVVLGGMGSLTGTIIAASIITFMPELLRSLQEYTGYDLRLVIYSLVLILLMIFRPQGLLGYKEIKWIKQK